MNKRIWAAVATILGGLLLLVPVHSAQPEPRPEGQPPFGPRGPGGPGGFPGQERKLVKQFDKDGDGRLNKEERQAARDFLKKERPAGGRGFGPGGPGGGFRGFGPGNFLAGALLRRADADKDGKLTPGELTAAAEALFKEADKDRDGKLDENELAAALALLAPPPDFGPPGGFGGPREPAKPGPRVAPADVKSYPDAGLYEPTVLRTLFLEFENNDWEAELADFHGTDVEVPATLTVDGKKYPHVGVHFRGMSSYMMVPAGYKRSLNLSLDFADPKQRLYGFKTLNLLNANGDPSLLSSVLYAHIARQYIPAPRVNLVKVVVNGESWGVYSNAQQFNKELVAEHFKSSTGARWKVRGSPGGGGGLDYLGENVEDYKRRYEIKSGDNDKDWKALVALCQTVSKTPTEQLEEALKPILDLDGVLWFLALDVALMNEDGYWIRASDYSIFRDASGKFHLLPHDMNEAFKPAMGFGFGGPGGRPGGGPGGGPGGPRGPGMAPRGGGMELDPLVGLDDARKPLRSRLLAVPALRQRYLAHVRTIAEEWLDWKKLGPVVAQYRQLIEKEVEADTRKLATYDAFRRATDDAPAAEGPPQGRGPGLSLRAFADQRRKYLLSHSEVKKATP